MGEETTITDAQILASILYSIKQMIGVPVESTDYDTDLIIHINSVFSTMTQLGIGPKSGFAITGPNDLWTDFIADDKKIAMYKSYMFMKVKLIFDSTTLSGSVIEAYNKLISEFEWRAHIEGDSDE